MKLIFNRPVDQLHRQAVPGGGRFPSSTLSSLDTVLGRSYSRTSCRSGQGESTLTERLWSGSCSRRRPSAVLVCPVLSGSLFTTLTRLTGLPCSHNSFSVS